MSPRGSFPPLVLLASLAFTALAAPCARADAPAPIEAPASIDPHFPNGPPASIPAPSGTLGTPEGTVSDGQVEEWPGRIGDDIIKGNFKLEDRFSDWLFEAIDDVNLFKINAGQSGFKVSTHRKVFDNHDVANTWTVVDTLRLETQIPLYQHGLLPGVFTHDIVNGFGVSLGASGQVNLIDIRQIRAAENTRVPETKILKNEAAKFLAEINRAENQGVLADEPVVGTGVEELDVQNAANDPALASLSYFDPLRKARYGRLWNMLTFPSRLPLKFETLMQLEDGEMMSYNLSGAIQLGVSFGSSNPLGNIFKNFAADLYASAYVKGEFRITVLKEDAMHARVKVSRSGNLGYNYGLGSRSDDPTIVHGMGVVGRWVDRRFYLTPITFSLDKSNGDALDVGYRFDFNRPEAARAYKLAMLGRFSYCEELATAGQGGVEKIFTRVAKISNEAFSQSAHLVAIFTHSRTSTYSDWDAEITLPDGTRKIVSTEVVNSNEWKLFWAFSEKFRYSFRVSADLDRAAAGQKDALYMTADLTIDDSSTSGEDMANYVSEVETAVGEPGIFPALPRFGPASASETQSRLDYGRSSFFYRLVYMQDQLDKFIAYPDDQMWAALEVAFDQEPGIWATPMSRFWQHLRYVPGNLLNLILTIINQPMREPPKLMHASGIQDDWAQLKTITDLSERTRKLGHIFRDSVYSKELGRLLRTVLKGESVQYVASGTASSFGRIWKQGHTRPDFHPVLERVNREIDFDAQGPRYLGDDNAVVTGLSLRVIGTGIYEMNLGTNVAPKAVFVRVSEMDPESRNAGRITGEYVVYNKDGRLISGENTVILDASGTDGWSTIAKVLEMDKIYSFSVAISQDSHNWGPINSARLRTPAIFDLDSITP